MSLKHFAQNHWPSVAIAVTAAVVACATLDAVEHATALDCHGDWPSRRHLLRGRGALPRGARRGRGGSAADAHSWIGRKPYLAARSEIRGKCRFDAGRNC